jgi:hypothetical protein
MQSPQPAAPRSMTITRKQHRAMVRDAKARQYRQGHASVPDEATGPGKAYADVLTEYPEWPLEKWLDGVQYIDVAYETACAINDSSYFDFPTDEVPA